MRQGGPLPLKDALLIACKNNLVELTTEIVDPIKDRPEDFTEAVRARIVDHQIQIMTDPTILDSENLAVASVLFCRDPLPGPLSAALESLGFTAVENAGSGGSEHSIFAKPNKGKRTRLSQWRIGYQRARDVSKPIVMFESELISTMPEGPIGAIHQAGTQALIEAAETLELALEVTLEGLEELERCLLRERAEVKGRMVFHPAAIRALACYAGDAIRTSAPATAWSSDADEDSPLFVQGVRGIPVQSDPILRVIDFLIQGRKATLSAYAEAVIEQSLTAARKT